MCGLFFPARKEGVVVPCACLFAASENIEITSSTALLSHPPTPSLHTHTHTHTRTKEGRKKRKKEARGNTSFPFDLKKALINDDVIGVVLQLSLTRHTQGDKNKLAKATLLPA